jgi:enoyl-CoA hydratase/carnithine racemase
MHILTSTLLFFCVTVGLQEAAQMIMTGKTLKADKAKKAGLVDLVVDPACLESAAIQQVVHMPSSLDLPYSLAFRLL